MNRMRPILVSITLLACAVLVTVSTCDWHECKKGRDMTVELIALAEEQGERIRAALEAYRQAHGEFPRRLGELSLPRSETRLPCGTAWTYERWPPGQGGYKLILGDYGTNHFQYYWNNETCQWHWDT